MPRKARFLMVLAALCVGVAPLWPLWEIRLLAPQYPEGLGLEIRANTVTGIKPNDLDNINGLNHYIGMKPITPDAIPELRWMPIIVACLAAGAAVVALAGRRSLAIGWLTIFAVVGVLGLWDFWRWGHDYGHDLDRENAIIVVPGMSYQPPIIGRKVLLNFTAVAWPGAGAALLGVAGLAAGGALLASRRKVVAS